MAGSSAKVYVDLTDLIEFAARRESASGVQRVIAHTAPLLVAHGVEPVLLDRARGVFVPIGPAEAGVLLPADPVADLRTREQQAQVAAAVIAQGRSLAPIDFGRSDVLVLLGAVWINDALMLALPPLHARGVRFVVLLYDLTPVLGAGHTPMVRRLFERYLNLILRTASRIPAISVSSRRDLEEYAREHGLPCPPGAATGLPCGVTPLGVENSPWPRPYALFVGTVEQRKRHELVLEAWRRLIAERGRDAVPDLVCIGRLGWNAQAFLEPYLDSSGLDGKVSLLSTSISDDELAAFYEHALFTVYPSSYEGWGLPVSESLAFGKVVVAADNSSLTEAGGDLASYFRSDDLEDLLAVLRRDALDPERRAQLEQRIRASASSTTWQQVADTVWAEILSAQEVPAVAVEVELGREYLLDMGSPAPDAGYADQVMRHLRTDGTTPMFGQRRRPEDVLVADAVVVGALGSPQTWGREVRAGQTVEFRFARPVSGPLVVLVATRAMPGVVSVEASGPGGPVSEQVYLGSVLSLPVGDGGAGEEAMVRLSIADATDSIEGFLGIRSFAVLRSDDLQAQVAAHKAAAAALRQELDYLQGTRSWKITAPLRRMKGRGAN